ncbi:ABC transporter ATP-binding protein [Corynebacterium frankenforstense]|uniref:ABC transporter ATP-binding protein n=1 Tax=Corynebacterium frankenforstense TaxID=1230998 RepID=UPI0009FA5965|nr:ABC transporter ATP-binding protein [Corynebacterium frankenforstense]
MTKKRETKNPAPPAIDVRDLTVVRGRNEILHSVSCRLEEGSITGLLGPSGCGKTTLIRAIVGAQKIAGGSVEVLGLPAGTAELRRRVAYTSQGLSIYRDISVAENVAYFAGVHGLDVSEVDRAIALVELEDQRDQRVDSLSGGQASRASLACALVGNPGVLLLDEPTVGLDPLTRESLWATFRRLADEGATLLISSHVMDEASHCDEVLLMRDGHFLAHESLDELTRRTGTASAEDAFLELVKRPEAYPGGEADAPHARAVRTDDSTNEGTNDEEGNR